jgi:flagellar protein FliO/FliZ
MEPVSVASSFISMISALAVILGLLFAAAWFLKRFLPRSAPGLADASAIKIIASRYLGPKSSIMIVDIVGKALVIGVSTNNVSLITELSSAEAREKLKTIREQNVNMQSLSDYMKKNKMVNRVKVYFGERSKKVK